MKNTINQAQRLMFDAMKMASFNEFDGPKVVADLMAHRDLWSSALMVRDMIPLLVLRDLPENLLSLDALYILPRNGSAPELETLARTWDADEVGWQERTSEYQNIHYSGLPGPVLRVWWD